MFHIDTEYLEGLLNRVGKRVFLEYYFQFKSLSQPHVSNADIVDIIVENFTLKSKQSRTSKAKRIFNEGLHLNALALIIESQHPQIEMLKPKAKQILRNELNIA